jgi:hypothetical protein
MNAKSAGQPVLCLCGGLQSSGSTLISWCFLQRRDMDGYLDANNDILADIPRDVGKPYAWYKTTISCFRLTEIAAHYREAGWDVRPLLLVRDVRHVWNSLARKPYGRNGTTAEDPPLRTRLRRFKEDWQQFHRQQWAILNYEKFLAEPEYALRRACRQLELPWDPGMMTWLKGTSEIADSRHGNRTFLASRGHSLQATVNAPSSGVLLNILPGDLDWMEKEFEEFNALNDYPLHTVASAIEQPGQAQSVPRFQVTRRNEWNIQRKPIRRLFAGLRRLVGIQQPVVSMDEMPVRRLAG